MGRLRQLYPQNYGSSSNIHTEIESLVRYLNSAELGNKTVGELLAQIFDIDGNFAGPIEFRKDSEGGIEYRIGTFLEEDDGWLPLLALDDVRGEPGANVGEIGAPLLYGRQDYAPAALATTLDYAYEATDAILAFVDGVLQTEGIGADYQLAPTGGTGGTSAVVFNVAFVGTESVSLFKVRSELITGYTRADTETVATQAVFPFVHDETSRLLVFLNGVLQREGGAYDYTTSATTDTVTFLTPVPSGNIVTIMTVENALTTAVTGLMLEENFVDLTSGLIHFEKINIEDEAIPQAKVSGLVSLAAESAKLTVSAGTPAGPVVGDLWLDTTATPNALKFYDGIQWLETTPVSAIPSFNAASALRVLRVNGTGTGLEFSEIDLSSVIPLSQKGSASGVATLDGSAKLPVAQLPDSISRKTIAEVYSGALANGTKAVRRIWNERVEVDSIALRLSAGTCSAQLAINGVGVGTVFSVSVTPTEVKLGQGGNPDVPQDVDATGASKTIGVIITAAAGASDLDVAIGCSVTPS